MMIVRVVSLCAVAASAVLGLWIRLRSGAGPAASPIHRQQLHVCERYAANPPRHGRFAKEIDRSDDAFTGGWSLEKHWQDGKAAELIGGKKWDAVVLQEQSLGPLENPAVLKEYVKKFDELIKKQGAKTVLFMTWARQEQAFDPTADRQSL